jgi:hypothetical protein
MKNCILIILFFCTHACFGNAIDSIKSKSDVIVFLDRYVPDKHYDPYERDTVIESYDGIFDNNQSADSFYLVDIDKNGLTDLIVDGKPFIVVLDLGVNRYNKLPLYGANFMFKGIRQSTTANLLAVRIQDIEENSRWAYDTTLTYKWEHMVEYVPVPANYSIDSIEFKYSDGYYRHCGELTHLRAMVRKDGRTNFYYENLCDKHGSKTQVMLLRANIQQLWDMMNYMHFVTLPATYGGFMLHTSPCQVKMFYNKGLSKTTTDLSGFSPLSLNAFYSTVFDLFRNRPPGRTDPLTTEEEKLMFIE